MALSWTAKRRVTGVAARSAQRAISMAMGHADLLIGAPSHASGGRSYVMFGGPGVGASGLVALSGLDGTNGFKLDGEASGDGSG